jgi:hypothetical protein
MMVALICPYCGFSKEVPGERIPEGIKWANCPQCRQRFELKLTDRGEKGENERQPEAAAVQRRQGAPWERRSELGLWQGAYGTLKSVLLNPRDLFRGLGPSNGMGEPLAFGWLTGSLGGMFSFFWQFLILSGALFVSEPALVGGTTAGLVFLAAMIIIPLLVLLGLLLTSGIVHLLLLMVQGGKNGFEATFRVVAYSQAALVWGVIPFIGGPVGGIWQLVVQVVGLREIHETSYARVIIAFLIPVALLFFVLAAGVLFLFRYVNW